MKTILILGGLTQRLHDLIRSQSSKRFVPNGILIQKPLNSRSYSAEYANSLLYEAHNYAVSNSEKEQISICLVYVNHPGSETQAFVNSFFPFALPRPIEPFEFAAGDKFSYRNALNNYLREVQINSRRVIEVSYIVKKFVDVRNLTPLLLPVESFSSKVFRASLESLYWQVAIDNNPENAISKAIKSIADAGLIAKAPGENLRCFTDGKLYFRSPGKNRHGFFRNSATGTHPTRCLLAARSRLGAPFDYTFHYDCIAVNGRLEKEYASCHRQQTSVRPTHVNIAPNDYVS
jgi:hypothetical protein